MIVTALNAARCATGEVEFEGGAPDGMAPVEERAPVEETAEDASMPVEDNGTMPVDTGNVDMDSGVVDTGVIDTGVVDTGVIDTGVVDTGARDTGVIDNGPVDTGVVDTGPVDTGPPPDLGPPARMCPSGLSQQTCRSGENCCVSLAGIPTGCGCMIPILGTCIPRGGPGC